MIVKRESPNTGEEDTARFSFPGIADPTSDSELMIHPESSDGF